MPYTRITGTRNGAESIRYAMDGKGHNGNADRNQIVSAINLLPGTLQSYTAQMDRYWRRASQKNKIQVRRIIQSFSRAEADPGNPNDIERVHRIGMEFAEKAYPGRQAIVCTQIDGKGGLVHNHILVNNISMIDSVVPDVPVGDGQYRDVLVPAGRGCIDAQTYFSYVKKHTNEIAAKYIILDSGKGRDAKLTQAERTKRDQDKYVWKDDLRERITKAQAEAADMDDFLSRLPAHGVTGTRKFSKKYGDYILYELTDTSRFGPGEKLPPNLKSKSYKLGDAYGPEGLQFRGRMQEAEQERAAVAAARKAELEHQRAARRAQVLQDAARLMSGVGHGEDGAGRDDVVTY